MRRGSRIADCGIVNDAVEGAEPIHLLGHAASLRDDREITDDHGLRARNSGQRFLASPLIASMQNYLVSPLNDELSRDSPQPIGRTGNEHPRHGFSPSSVKDAAKALHDAGTRGGGFIEPRPQTGLSVHTGPMLMAQRTRARFAKRLGVRGGSRHRFRFAPHTEIEQKPKQTLVSLSW